MTDYERGRLAGLREAAGIASQRARDMESCGLMHSEDSAPRDRCFARSREATEIAALVLAASKQGVCEWEKMLDEDQGAGRKGYRSGCGHTTGTRTQRGVCYCGLPIKIKGE